MDNNDIFEVEYEYFKGLMDQIKTECITITHSVSDEKTVISAYSTDKKRHFSDVIISDTYSKYYIYDMPLPEECLPPKKIRKIVLKNKEEAQAFFNILSQLCKEGKK